MDFATYCDESNPGSWNWKLDVITTLERDMILHLYELGVYAAFSHREHQVKAIFTPADGSNVSYEKYYDPGEYMNFLLSKTGIADIVRKVRNLETERALKELDR